MSSVYSPATLDLLYFEDLPLGGEWLSRRRTLTEADLALYRGVAGDLNPLHADMDHAAGSELGMAIPGPLLTAVALGLGSIDAPVPATVALVGMTWRYLRPVRPGQPISARWRLNRKRDVENPRWGLVTWMVDVLGPDGETCAAGEVSRLVARRSAEVVEAVSPAVAGPEEEEAAAAPSSSRRRRRRRSGSSAAPAAESAPPAPTPEVPGVPEPAPADVPSPARRRRRRRSGSGNTQPTDNGPEPAPSPEPPPVSAPEPAPEPITAARRVLSRLRGTRSPGA